MLCFHCFIVRRTNFDRMQLCGLKERAFSFLKVFDSLWGYANTVDERANNRKVYTIWSWGWHLHFRHSSKNFLWLTSNGLPIRLQPIMSQTVWPICRIVTVSLLFLFWLIVILISNSHFFDTKSYPKYFGQPDWKVAGEKWVCLSGNLPLREQLAFS